MVTLTALNQKQLDAALPKLKGGDTLLLGAGSYSLTLSGKSFASKVTITSRNLANPATLSWLKLVDTSNVTFTNLDIGRSLRKGDSTDSILSQVSGGSNITFDRIHFHGSLNNNPRDDGTGINVGGVDHIKIVNSEFEQLGRGAIFGGSKNIFVLNNKFHDIRSDGVDFAQVNGVTIDGNSFTDFHRNSDDHPDAIQFWTAGTTRPSTDIVIRNNVILEGKGDGIQGIFLRDELGNKNYQRVTIQNNLVYEANMPNGIYVSGARNLKIIGNTALSPQGDSISVWIRAENIKRGTISGNLTDALYLGSNTGLAVTNNLMSAKSNLSASVLSPANLAAATAAKLRIASHGFAAPSTAAVKSAAVSKTAAVSRPAAETSLSAFSPGTLADTLPEAKPVTNTSPFQPYRGKIGDLSDWKDNPVSAGEFFTRLLGMTGADQGRTFFHGN